MFWLVFSYLATLVSFVGVYYNAHKNAFCWKIWIIADLMWFSYGLNTGQFALCILHTAYFLSNLYGLRKWRGSSKDQIGG